MSTRWEQAFLPGWVLCCARRHCDSVPASLRYVGPDSGLVHQ